ncbi:hypothetical protein Franean1_5644 [Parafrankia sp. EAN1pec]|uniref:VOC family protein n=1 Tax=Parafrankia sp. (strain EAN1pec) TaxID=298653 RepID=UPI0000540877|nr:hypothetical protein Franean1_5644 [Frankia sp. EAN1pec]
MTRADSPLGHWEPASLTETASIFAAFPAPWWIAGGYAIELAVGHQFRGHSDIDVAVLRRDQLAVQRVLAGWEWWAADPPGTLRRWEPGETLPSGIHDIWCRQTPDGPWRIQVMLEEAAGTDWVSRRDPRIRRPVSALGNAGPTGIPYIAPEVQLLYKSQASRPKDETDFAAVLPLLATDRRRWLSDALAATHPWQRRLSPDAKIDLIVLYCSDLSACHEFYQDLGLEFRRERHGTGPGHYAATFADGAVLELYPAGARGPTRRVRIGLTVRRADLGDTQLAPGRHVLQDPEGHAVDVQVVG